jgi:hypothetical protein
MDRRILLQGFLAFLIGFAVLLAEVTVAGILACNFQRTNIPHDITMLAFQVQEFALGLLTIWGLASLIGAWLLALLKPRRWGLYSLCAVTPGVIEAVWGAVRVAHEGIPVGYQLLSDAVRLALVPLFLALIYATLRRQMGAA